MNWRKILLILALALPGFSFAGDFLAAALTGMYLHPVGIQLKGGDSLRFQAGLVLQADGSIAIIDDSADKVLQQHGIQRIIVPVEKGADHLATLFENAEPTTNRSLQDRTPIWMFSSKSDPEELKDFVPTVWSGLHFEVSLPDKNGVSRADAAFAEVNKLGITSHGEMGISATTHRVDLSKLPSTKSSAQIFPLAGNESEIQDSLLSHLSIEMRSQIERQLKRNTRAQWIQRMKARGRKFLKVAGISFALTAPIAGTHYWAHLPENKDIPSAKAIRHYEKLISEKFNDCLPNIRNLR